MKNFEVYEKATGKQCYAYTADAPVEYREYPFDLYEHRDVGPVPRPTLPEGSKPWAALIDIGPFTDRLGPAVSFSIETSTDPYVVAVRKNMERRKYLDLVGEPMEAALATLQARLPDVITSQVIQRALQLPVAPSENFALRMTYFNGEGGRG